MISLIGDLLRPCYKMWPADTPTRSIAVSNSITWELTRQSLGSTQTQWVQKLYFNVVPWWLLKFEKQLWWTHKNTYVLVDVSLLIQVTLSRSLWLVWGGRKPGREKAWVGKPKYSCSFFSSFFLLRVKTTHMNSGYYPTCSRQRGKKVN